MSGVKGHSGRRGSANRGEDGTFQSGGDGGRVPFEDGGEILMDTAASDFPDELDTVEQIRLAARWVWRQQCRGQFDARTGDALNTTLKTALAAIRTAHGLDELERLRDLVKRMEAAQGSMRARADQERTSSVTLGAGTSTTLGRRPAPPDDDKH